MDDAFLVKEFLDVSSNIRKNIKTLQVIMFFMIIVKTRTQIKLAQSGIKVTQ